MAALRKAHIYGKFIFANLPGRALGALAEKKLSAHAMPAGNPAPRLEARFRASMGDRRMRLR